MAAKKDNPPPFEIMRSGPATVDTASNIPAEPERNGSGVVPATGVSPGPAWLASLRRPMVIRIPMGIAILASLAVLLILIVAYWVGNQQGQATVHHELAQQQRQLDGVAPRGQTDGLISAGSGQWASGGQAQEQTEADPRIDEQNYLVLARYPRAEALRLSEFLAGHGVETGVFSTDNAELYVVVDLLGFSSSAVRTDRYEQRKAELKRLGRQWKSQEDGPTDLSDLYGQKYRAPR